MLVWFKLQQQRLSGAHTIAFPNVSMIELSLMRQYHHSSQIYTYRSEVLFTYLQYVALYHLFISNHWKHTMSCSFHLRLSTWTEEIDVSPET